MNSMKNNEALLHEKKLMCLKCRSTDSKWINEQMHFWDNVLTQRNFSVIHNYEVLDVEDNHRLLNAQMKI